jgi:hypothetical protein
VHKVDPLARPVGKSNEVLGCRGPLRLEAPHLTRRSRAPLRRFAADNPAHGRIAAQALGVVHILVSGKATKYRLPEKPGQCVSTILATACVGQDQAAVEIQPNSIRSRFTPWVRHRRLARSRVRC